jgi:pimeloyl-ACP methyl ester carboxylesterase
MDHTPRVAIVGTGFVGLTTAYALLMSGLTAEIVLIDRARRRAEGDVHDLRDAEVFSHNTRVFAREFGDCCSADDALPSEYAALFNGLATASSDNTMLIPWEIWRDNFIQDAPEPLARSLWQQLSPEPNQVNLDSLDLKRFYSLSIPSSFIYCRQDRALPQGYFHPRMSSRLGKFRLVEMNGSHEVMFTRPEELADRIIDASIE